MDFQSFNAHIPRRDGFDLPRPIASGLSLAAVGVVPLVLGLADVIRPLSGLVFAAIFLTVGALKSALEYRELIVIRRRADLELRGEPRPYGLSSFAQLRARELTSDRHRLALARSVARTERALSPAFLPSASPLNRVAARPQAELLRRLAERLAALDRPVTPQALLEVEELLTSPESPLYARERAHELRQSLLTSIHALDALALHIPTQTIPSSQQTNLETGGYHSRPLAAKTGRRHMAVLRAPRTRLRRIAMAYRRGQR